MKIDAHRLLALHILAEKLPPPVHEYRFHPKRKWRFDMAWPDYLSPGCTLIELIAVEIDGEGHYDKREGRWIPGRHHRTKGYRDDLEKINAAVELGWRVFRYVPAQVESGEAIRQLKRVLL